MNRLARFMKSRCQAWRKARLKRTFRALGATGSIDSLNLVGMAPHLEIAGTVELDGQVTFRSVTRQVFISVAAGATLKIGAYSYINQGANLAVTRGLTLGRRCLVAEEVNFFDTNFHEVDQGTGVASAPIVVGDNVWIGHGSIILPGTRLGDHSVVAAGSVVRGEFPARSLVAGVPARLIRTIRCADDFFRL